MTYYFNRIYMCEMMCVQMCMHTVSMFSECNPPRPGRCRT